MARVSTSTSSGHKENRKIPKPLLERKRRARMNKSLCELEKLLSDLISIESKSRKNGKVEKADILEIAVHRLRQLDAKCKDAPLFQQGYRRCLNEVTSFLENNISTGADHLVSNLSNYVLQKSETFCSVIRHTKQVTEEVTSTVDSRCADGNDESIISSSSSCDLFTDETTSSKVWRPWGQQVN